MDKYISKSQLISVITVIVAVILICGIWPFGFIHRTLKYESTTDMVIESEEATKEAQISQLFFSDGTKLQYIDVYIAGDMKDKEIDFAVYDGELNRIFHRVFVPDAGQDYPGYLRVDTRLKVERGMPYFFSLYGVEDGLKVGLEDHYSTSNMALYTINFAGNEDADHNICARLKFTLGLPLWQIIICDAIIAVIVLMIIYLTQIYYGIREGAGRLNKLYNRGKDKRFVTQKVVAYVFTPVIVVSAIASLYTVFPKRLFGDSIPDIVVLDLGIVLLTSILLNILNHKRTVNGNLMIVKYIKDHISGWLISISLAMMLWYCFEYMNGLYDIHHAYSSRKILIWFFISVIATYSIREIKRIPNLLWTLLGPVGVFAYIRMNTPAADEELIPVIRYNAYIAFVGGYVLINLIYTIIDIVKGRSEKARIDKVCFVAVIIFAVGIMALANTRTWPYYMVFIMSVLAFRLWTYEHRDMWLEYLCNGIILNFVIMLVFSLMHRPYHGYIYYRYDMSYFTVTMTATHLTLCLAAVAVRLYIVYKRSSDIKISIPELALFGTVACYLIFTLSRTGYAAAVVMVFFGLMIMALRFEDKRVLLRNSLICVVALVLSTVVMFPIVFSATRTIPAVVDDPVIYEYEPCIATIYKGTKPDDRLYMSVDKFFRVFGSKILKVGDTLTYNDGGSPLIEKDRNATVLLASMADSDVTSNGMIMIASSDGFESSDEESEDISNGRLSIFKSYIDQSNMWGHDTMGAILEDGSEAAHAHNIFLQVIYDHGIVFGTFFVFFMLLSLIVSIRNVVRSEKPDYKMLPMVLLIGFIVAGIVEWIFHPCNPYGLSILLCLTTMIFERNK